MAKSKKDRSEAAKKAASTRKRNAENNEQKQPSTEQEQQDTEPQAEQQDSQQSEDDQVPAKFRKENLDVDRSEWANRREPTPEQRVQELEEAQRVHAERTGGGEVREGELVAQHEAHNERTGDVSR